MELLYFPSTIPAAEALTLGLATKVVPDADLTAEVAAIATKLATGPTLSYASIRQSVNYSASHSFTESLAFEGTKMNQTGARDDHRRAVEAFLTKTKAQFTGS
jgi:2-(1,2-epoxy-1,2-dihydrophenyl)acetyl-CoA isomerase